VIVYVDIFFFSSSRRHTRSKRDWSSDVCSSDLHVSKRIVPSHAIIGITSGIFIGFMLNVLAQFLNKSLANIFVIVYSSSVLPGMVAWFVILLAELRFRRKNPHLMENHPFKLPLYPYSNYFALIMLVVIVVFMFINPETQISVAVGAA